MGAPEWKDEYSVHIREIDAQHKHLFAVVRELHEAVEKNGGHDAISLVLGRLFEYVRFHFETEEKYMTEHNFPGHLEHLVEHQEFLLKLVKMRRDFEDGGTDVAPGLLVYLETWIEKHVQGTDQKLAPYFKDRGIS